MHCHDGKVLLCPWYPNQLELHLAFHVSWSLCADHQKVHIWGRKKPFTTHESNVHWYLDDYDGMHSKHQDRWGFMGVMRILATPWVNLDFAGSGSQQILVILLRGHFKIYDKQSMVAWDSRSINHWKKLQFEDHHFENGPVHRLSFVWVQAHCGLTLHPVGIVLWIISVFLAPNVENWLSHWPFLNSRITWQWCAVDVVNTIFLQLLQKLHNDQKPQCQEWHAGPHYVHGPPLIAKHSIALW